MAGFVIKEENIGENPPSGYIHVYANPDAKAVVRNAAGDEQVINSDVVLKFSWDNGDTVVPNGSRTVVVEAPCDLVIERSRVMSNTLCTLQADIWRAVFNSLPLTQTFSICAVALPSITAAYAGEDVTLTGWNNNIGQGNVLCARINSISAGSKVTLSLFCRKD